MKTNGDDTVDSFKYSQGTPHGFKERINYGLTKREYFAAKAMQGMSLNAYTEGNWKLVAELAIVQADALIAELNKENK